MKPAPFEYASPTSLEAALALRAEHADESVFLAGGQSLMPLLNLRVSQPELVIDLRRVPGLDGIHELGDGGVALGAMTRQRDVERSPLVAGRCRLLGAALEHVAHPTIRNRGTIGGSLVHAFPSAELPAVALALDAELVARSADGERVIAAKDFFLGPMMSALEPNELLVEVRFPREVVGGAAFLEVSRRHGDFALVGAGAVVRTAADQTVEEARLVLIGVGSVPVRPAIETSLRGARATATVFDEVAIAAAAELDPIGDLHASAEYRRTVARTLARRALLQASAYGEAAR
jgi:carbon-monoxide dehydrogenase medium subunit